jgi:hypothetical protein
MWEYIFVGVVVVALIFVGVYLYLTVKHSNGGGIDSCIDPATNQPFPPGWQRPNCDYVTEDTFTTAIAAPQAELYLGDFYYSVGAASGGFCLPTYYSYRYVRISDGAYGPLSAWSPPIQSCACSLPCYPPTQSTPVDQRCSVDGILLGDQLDIHGNETCSYNTPVLVVMEPIPTPYNDTSSYAINVHRYSGVTPPSDTEEGEIVGVLFAFPSPDTTGWCGKFTDVLYSVSSPGDVCEGQKC